MNVALTGSIGFTGCHVLADLREHGHEVTALVSSERQAATVAAGGATGVVVDLFDRREIASALSAVDAAIHTASPGDATSVALDSTMVDAAIDAFAGTGKPYAHISSLWIYGSNRSVTEDSPFDAPALVAWKLPIQARLLYGSDIRAAVVVSGTAYGDGGGGIPAVLLGSPRDDAGNLVMLGSGRQHWARVHVADLAEVFRLVLEHESARGYYIVEDGSRPTVADLTEAVAVAASARGAVPGSSDEARARLGDAFAEVLLLDQSTSATKARNELGWRPSHPRLVDDFRDGSYRTRQMQEQR